MEDPTDVVIRSERIPGKHVVEVAGKRFVVDTKVMIDFVQATRGLSGWGHLGPWLVHTSGVVIGPQFDLDVPLTNITIDADQHAECARLYEGLLRPNG